MFYIARSLEMGIRGGPFNRPNDHVHLLTAYKTCMLGRMETRLIWLAAEPVTNIMDCNHIKRGIVYIVIAIAKCAMI